MLTVPIKYESEINHCVLNIMYGGVVDAGLSFVAMVIFWTPYFACGNTRRLQRAL
jgi:hypothetical protein